jgi:hypothetical protein
MDPSDLSKTILAVEVEALAAALLIGGSALFVAGATIN